MTNTNSTKADSDRLWFTRTDSASLCGVGFANFDLRIRPRLKPDAIRGTGRTLRFHGPALVTTMVEYRTKPKIDDESDPLLVGSESPALERYRRARANLAELDLAEREKTLIRLAMISNAIRPALLALRGVGDRLARLFGNGAGEMYNEGVADFEAAAMRAIDNAGDSGADAETQERIEAAD